MNGLNYVRERVRKYYEWWTPIDHDDQLSSNPYSSLPDIMIIYRSCYPIRMDQASNKITCSKTSIGLNVRIYDMTVEFKISY